MPNSTQVIASISVVVVASAAAWGLGNALEKDQVSASEQASTRCGGGKIGASVELAGGRYTMGSDRHYPEEGPTQEVDVDPFAIDQHEVTNGQFRAFVEATGYVTSAEKAESLGFPRNGSAVFADGRWQFVDGANWRHPSGPSSNIEGRDQYPVVQVSLQDAKAYAEWAGRRLPSEVEWEFAARGGLEGKEYAWGDERFPQGRFMANNWDGSFPAHDTGADGHVGIAPVGCYPANGFGLVDMIGNVWEWTVDSYQPGHESMAHDGMGQIGHDPRQPGVPVGTIKGGSYLCSPDYCMRYRPAARHPQDIYLGTNHIGFRTVAS